MKIKMLRHYLTISMTILLICAPIVNGQKCAENTSAVVAVVNGRSITLGELDSTIAQELYTLQERMHALRAAALDNLISRLIIDGEAERRGISVAQMLPSLVPERVIIEEKDVDLGYAQNSEFTRGLNEYEAKGRIRIDLESRKKLDAMKTALAQLKEDANIKLLLSAPIPPTVVVSTSGPARGPVTAPVTLVEFSDFQCPFCKNASAIVAQLEKHYGSNIRTIFKHNPLPIHPAAFPAAQASYCAEKVGKFWEYHDLLFGSSGLSRDILKELAVFIGMDSKKFDECLNSEESKMAVLKDLAEGRRLGVQGTPTFFVNGKVLRGLTDINGFKRVIDTALEAK